MAWLLISRHEHHRLLYLNGMNMQEAYRLIQQKLIAWGEELVGLIPNLLLALALMGLFLLLAHVSRRLVRRLLQRLIDGPTLVSLAGSLTYVSILGLGLFVALSVLKLDKAVTSILAGAGIIGLALAFAFQDLAANFISGIFISLRRPLRVGDLIETDDTIGVVQSINLRDLILLNFQGQEVIIPNKDVFQRSVKNYTHSGMRRLDLEGGISYGDNLRKVQEVSLKALENLPGSDAQKSMGFYFTGFGDSSIDYLITIWLADTDQLSWLKARSEAVIRLKEAYDANNITIPFPIRTLDFGIKGGKTWRDMQLPE